MAKNLLRIQNVVNSQTKNQNRFSMNFVGLGSLLTKNGNYASFPGVKERFAAVVNALKRNEGNFNVNETLQLSLLSATLPNIQVETQRIPRFNDTVVATTKFAEPEDMTINFVDYVDGSASAILLLWQAYVADKRTGAMGFKQSFVLPRAEFIAYGPDAPGYENLDEEDKWIEKHEIINLFPKAVNLGEHSFENGEFRRVECTFSIDNCYPIAYRNFVVDEDGLPQYSEATTEGSIAANIGFDDLASVVL